MRLAPVPYYNCNNTDSILLNRLHNTDVRVVCSSLFSHKFRFFKLKTKTKQKTVLLQMLQLRIGRVYAPIK